MLVVHRKSHCYVITPYARPGQSQPPSRIASPTLTHRRQQATTALSIACPVRKLRWSGRENTGPVILLHSKKRWYIEQGVVRKTEKTRYKLTQSHKPTTAPHPNQAGNTAGETRKFADGDAPPPTQNTRVDSRSWYFYLCKAVLTSTSAVYKAASTTTGQKSVTHTTRATCKGVFDMTGMIGRRVG